MTRTLALGLAAIGLAVSGQSATANSCLPQHHAYIHRVHYEHRVPTYHRSDVRYVVVERPRYRTVYEEVYEPVAPAPYVAPSWTPAPYVGDWEYEGRPSWNVGFYDGW